MNFISFGNEISDLIFNWIMPWVLTCRLNRLMVENVIWYKIALYAHYLIILSEIYAPKWSLKDVDIEKCIALSDVWLDLKPLIWNPWKFVFQCFFFFSFWTLLTVLEVVSSTPVGIIYSVAQKIPLKWDAERCSGFKYYWSGELI